MISRLLGALRAVFVNNWPQKLGALLAAALVWWFATVGDSPQTQATRVVRLQVQGLPANSVATGVPDTAALTIRGPSVLIERLQSQGLSAVIDLDGQTGDFQEPINVLIPRGVELLSVTPGDVIGTVETLAERAVPLEAVIIGTRPGDVHTDLEVDPEHVTVTGLTADLDLVTRVIAPVRSSPGERTVSGYAADLDGQPVGGVSVEPEEVQVTVRELPLLVQATVPLELTPPEVDGFDVTVLTDSAELTVTGPPSALAELDSVTGTPDLATGEPAAGTVSVPVLPELPEGVFTGDAPAAEVRLVPLVREE
ncbi:MAG TPA: hypothetical protein VK092_07265 [Deinococcales bacterium]|nr:hypothetical protein [Deinococcales bacterium]